MFDGEGVKADVDFGPTLMLNRNRCILCTRCVRFMREVDGDAQINIIDRGYGSEIATFQEEGVHSLLSGNLMDVCPVGAITTRDYRFKSRPWDNPNAVDTICTLCAKGCNTTAWIKAKPEWAKGSQLIRFTPRFNPDVNGYWMCDIGRFDYHWIEGDDRLRKPLARDRRRVCSEPVSWHDADRRSCAIASAAAGDVESRRRPLPALRARLARGAVPVHAGSTRSCSAPTGRRRSASAGGIARSRSRRHEVQGPRRSTRRTSTARASSASCRAAPGGEVARRGHLARCERRSRPDSVTALYVFDPGPGRLARRHRRGSSRRASAGRSRCSSCRACC